ncbi:unnamed protein product [Dibothriocephalus latus]|uniref:FATC domain-containing protein n=1 Tax=Dibothriocephalus latus TaxID=60516 RepID=A0A3P7LG34_DIBLA|nr:unnamed protein product [Dibothriocephalus latus]
MPESVGTAPQPTVVNLNPVTVMDIAKLLEGGTKAPVGKQACRTKECFRKVTHITQGHVGYLFFLRRLFGASINDVITRTRFFTFLAVEAGLSFEYFASRCGKGIDGEHPTEAHSFFVLSNIRISEATVFAAETGKLGGSPDALWTRGGSALVSRFLALERLVFSMRLLRRGLCQLASSPEHYSMLRWRLISSHAAISAAHYILVILPTPEYVPLRLTASLRELLEPSGPAGHFGVALSQALSALRGSSNLFFSVLKVSPVTFLREDCALRFAGRTWFADCANTLRRTVDVTTTEAVGGSRSTSEELLTPAEQARRLVCLSTSPELLARMHPGWNASL